MIRNLNKNQIARFSRQIILKNIGALGQKKIIKSKVLIIGMGGLGCSVAEFLTRAGIGSLGIIDFDNVDITNIHRQSLYDVKDIEKSKVIVAKKKLRKINSNTKVNCYKVKLNKGNIKNIISKQSSIDCLPICLLGYSPICVCVDLSIMLSVYMVICFVVYLFMRFIC